MCDFVFEPNNLALPAIKAVGIDVRKAPSICDAAFNFGKDYLSQQVEIIIKLQDDFAKTCKYLVSLPTYLEHYRDKHIENYFHFHFIVPSVIFNKIDWMAVYETQSRTRFDLRKMTGARRRSPTHSEKS